MKEAREFFHEFSLSWNYFKINYINVDDDNLPLLVPPVSLGYVRAVSQSPGSTANLLLLICKQSNLFFIKTNVSAFLYYIFFEEFYICLRYPWKLAGTSQILILQIGCQEPHYRKQSSKVHFCRIKSLQQFGPIQHFQSPTPLPPRTSTYQGTFKPLCLRSLCSLFWACPSPDSSTDHNWGPTPNFPSFAESSLIPNCSVLGRNGHLLPSILLEHFVNTLTCAMSTRHMPVLPPRLQVCWGTETN